MFNDSPNQYSSRVKYSFLVVVVVFSILLLRVTYLQIFKGSYYLQQSENNNLRQIKIAPPRGKIFDVNGEVLASNRPSFNLELITEGLEDPHAILETISSLTSLELELLQTNFKRYKSKRHKYESKLIFKNISRDIIAVIEANKFRLPGVIITSVPARYYPNNDFATHLLGFTREINSEQLKKDKYENYIAGDLIGQQGLERFYEDKLQGKRGEQGLIVNVNGQKIRESYYRPAIAGNDITLTIDAKVQRAAENALGENWGIVIALNPNNGEVVALVSKPSFDPNLFSSEISRAVWSDLISGKGKKLQNRVVSGVYPPGSLFKIFMATAGLSENIISPNETVYCPGHFRIGKSRPFHCHKLEGHGHEDLTGALKQSCNVYFYTLGQKLGIDKIHDHATSFGLGERTGIEFINEQKGLVPSREWKKKYFKKKEDQTWYPGETPSVSIGQGAISVTPIQIARALATFVNGGNVYKASIVKSSDNNLVRKIELDTKVIDEVKKGLYAVVNEKKGTGSKAKLKPEIDIDVAGKTATAQIKSSKFLEGKDRENHAWFAGFAPYENPELVVVALVEHGGHGGSTAAPVVREVFKSYFSSVEVQDEL